MNQKPFPYDVCPECGDMLIVETECSLDDDYFYDGDTVRCMGCNMEGNISIGCEGAYVNF
jgi:hypothetical protein